MQRTQRALANVLRRVTLIPNFARQVYEHNAVLGAQFDLEGAWTHGKRQLTAENWQEFWTRCASAPKKATTCVFEHSRPV